MSIRNSAPIAIASMALGLSLGTALSLSASHTAPAPTVTVVPAPVVIAPGTQLPPSPPADNIIAPTIAPSQPLEGLRPANAGQASKVGERVLARWYDGSWWEAEVTAIGQGSVTAAWADGSPPDQLPLGDVAPLPSQSSTLEIGSYAFCSWQSSTQWWRARIVERSGIPTIAYIDGDSSPLSSEHCVLARFADR